jgi:hypothetical protein
MSRSVVIPSLWLIVTATGAADEALRPPEPGIAPRREAAVAPTGAAVEDAQQASQTPLVVYRPPHRGAPGQKLGSGLRAAPALPTLVTLAPEHVAETSSPSPSLFWHIDSLPPSSARVVFTLIAASRAAPIVEAELGTPDRPGIHRVRLSDLQVTLEPAVEYEWSVSLTADPRHGDAQCLDRGFLRRVPSRAPLPMDGSSVRASAQLDYWYDALEAISDQIDDEPSNRALRAQRNALLAEGGLELAVDPADVADQPASP